MKRLLLTAVLALASSHATVSIAEDIALVTPTGTIHGTLLLPDAAAPMPVVLIIAGSGPTNRDGNSALLPQGNDSLKLLAEALASAGFASVRFDKRGIAASAGAATSEAELRFEHYVDDAAAWIAQLSADSRFSATAIAGHSEGALIGLIAAVRAQTPFVSIAGSADDAATLIRRQLAGRLPPELAAKGESVLSGLEAGRTSEDVPAELLSLYRPSVQPYLISWIRYKPREEFAKLQAPCLIVQGTTDIQIAVADSEGLAAANPSCELKIIDGMNHVLKTVPADMPRQQSSYSDPALPLTPAFAEVITEFLRRATASNR
jgi:pimeloyl-ACP methyl ester carboxylesterase